MNFQNSATKNKNRLLAALMLAILLFFPHKSISSDHSEAIPPPAVKITYGSSGSHEKEIGLDKDATVWWIIADPHIGIKEGVRPYYYDDCIKKAIQNDINPNLHTDYAIVLGDFVQNSAQYVSTFDEHMNYLKHDWTYILGNHDQDVEDNGTGEHAKEVNYFSRIISGVRIIALSDESGRAKDYETTLNEEQDNWFRNELRANPQIPTIIMTHHSPIFRSFSAWDKWLKDEIYRYNIVLWLTGHEHKWNIEKNYGGYGFDEIRVADIIGGDFHGGLFTFSEGGFLSIKDKGDTAEIKFLFRDHDVQEWITVDGYEEYILEVKKNLF